MNHGFRDVCLALCLGLGLLSPNAAVAQDAVVPIASDAHTSGMTFTPQGLIAYAVTITNVQGRVAVCGMWYERERISGHMRAVGLQRRALQRTVIYLGDRRIMRGVGHFTEVDDDTFKAGTRVNCKATSIPWQRGYSNKGLRAEVEGFRQRL